MVDLSSWDSMTTTDGRLLRGEQTRRAILERAAEIATIEGLEGLSIGRLAAELQVSKSGVFAHFGSKEELQLATVDRARDVFVEQVIAPARELKGLARLRAMCDNRLAYQRARIFPGGCFFYSAEMEYSGRPGRVHDAIVTSKAEWSALLERTIEKARDAGELRADVDVKQLAFELDAFVAAANAATLMGGDETAIDRAERAMLARLDAVAA